MSQPAKEALDNPAPWQRDALFEMRLEESKAFQGLRSCGLGQACQGGRSAMVRTPRRSEQPMRQVCVSPMSVPTAARMKIGHNAAVIGALVGLLLVLRARCVS
jgi:hypothetical protein